MEENETIHITIPSRLYQVPVAALLVGTAIGAVRGSRKEGLRFLAENAHRAPTTLQGWYFYNKTKNYRMILGGLVEGGRQGAKLSAAAMGWVTIEESIRRFGHGFEQAAEVGAGVGTGALFGLVCEFTGNTAVKKEFLFCFRRQIGPSDHRSIYPPRLSRRFRDGGGAQRQREPQIKCGALKPLYLHTLPPLSAKLSPFPPLSYHHSAINQIYAQILAAQRRNNAAVRPQWRGEVKPFRFSHSPVLSRLQRPSDNPNNPHTLRSPLRLENPHRFPYHHASCPNLQHNGTSKAKVKTSTIPPISETTNIWPIQRTDPRQTHPSTRFECSLSPSSSLRRRPIRTKRIRLQRSHRRD